MMRRKRWGFLDCARRSEGSSSVSRVAIRAHLRFGSSSGLLITALLPSMVAIAATGEDVRGERSWEASAELTPRKRTLVRVPYRDVAVNVVSGDFLGEEMSTPNQGATARGSRTVRICSTCFVFGLETFMMT